MHEADMSDRDALSGAQTSSNCSSDDPSDVGSAPQKITRREFIADAAVAGAGITAAVIPGAPAGAMAGAGRQSPGGAAAAHDEIEITLRINGKDLPVKVEPRVTLLDALRERLSLPGTKKGCDHGQCGACTVHIDGRRVLSCLSLAIMHQGQSITTIEGLANGDELHPMQAAFLAHDGFQCGYCTPGQIMSAVALVKEDHAHTDAEIKEQMSGNLCRCGAYPNIVAAIREVQEGKKHAAI